MDDPCEKQEPEPRQTSDRYNETFDVNLLDRPRRPITDPTLGVPVAKSEGEKHDSRRLVALGDSLTQGFQHLAIKNTSISWPAMIAARLGLGADEFRYPVFPEFGGYPYNLEVLLGLLTDEPLKDIESILAHLMEVKHYYVPIDGPLMPDPIYPNDNLAVWGWDIRDLLSRTVETERTAIGHEGRLDELSPKIGQAMNRTGLVTLAEIVEMERDGTRIPMEGPPRTALELAHDRGNVDGTDGIETLLIWIGSNNALGAISTMKIVPSGDDFKDLNKKSAYNVWLPKHFEEELKELEGEVAKIKAEHVIWGTVPHVTIPPLAHGLRGRLPDNHRYFNYYAYPWEDEKSFKPDHPHLTGEEAWTIDSVIDAYNDAIVAMVRRQRCEFKRDWRIVDTCGLLDRLAVRRNGAEGQAFDYLPPYEFPKEYIRDGKNLDTRFIDVEEVDASFVLRAGGLIGLDGVHPTTAGYGLVADEFMKVMHDAGVAFPNLSNGDAPHPVWAEIIKADSILSNLPVRIDGALDLIRTLEEKWDVISDAEWA
ncbi:hypothetical protein GCM10023087_22110 [Microbacterium rhizosphaerae]